MIGTWRWLLAMLVVIGHLYHPWWPATFGVFSFFIISGFLMTLIMNQNYGYTRTGFKGFWINRFLRLYPAYYLACLLSIILISYVPAEFLLPINGKLVLPDSPYQILTNLFIVGLQHAPNQSSLVPPAWALSIEIVYYLVISIWAGKNRTNAALFLFLGLVYLLVVALLKDNNFWYRYFHVGAGALPFAIGVNIYFYREQLYQFCVRMLGNNLLPLSLLIYIGIFIGASITGQIRTTFFYLNIISSALVLLALWHTPSKSGKRLDAFIGDLSYPTYLIHWQVGILVAYVTGLTYKSLATFLVSAIIITLLSVLEAKTISGSIERYRKRIKETIKTA